jgi:hypothetical protein
MTTTTSFELPLLYANQAQKDVTVNQALTDIDRLLQLNVLDTALTAPPASPVVGDKYIVAPGATGGWLTHDRELAIYGDSWAFLAPVSGWVAYSVADASLYVFNGVNWVSVLVDVGTLSGTLAVSHGGTGATTVSDAQVALGIVSQASQAVSTSGTSLAIDLASGGHVALALGHNISVAFTVAHWPAAGTFGRLMLEITNGGANNITAWPGTTIWAGGAAPTITSGNGKKDTIILTSIDGGTNFRGYVVAQNMA